MPRYMLDTNMCLCLIKNQPEAVAKRFAACCVGDVVMSAVTFAELAYGVSVSKNPQKEGRNLERLTEDIPVAPFDPAAGLAYGTVGMRTRTSKQDHFDQLIAAHAIALDVVLVTNQLRDFAQYPELKTENWLNT
jgi:tRNA(fMet)-specific endonuclease VapC